MADEWHEVSEAFPNYIVNQGGDVYNKVTGKRATIENFYGIPNYRLENDLGAVSYVPVGEAHDLISGGASE